MTHPFFTGAARPRLFAHRGLVTAEGAADGLAENSFAAVAAAHAAGASFVESDCHLTRDGVAVLFHDDDLERVTADTRRVADVSLRQLEELMADRGGLLSLAQALEAFPSLRFNLDVKAAEAAEAVGRTIASDAHRVLLTSFSDQRRRVALAAAHAQGAAIVPATSPGTRTIALLLCATAVRSQRWVNRLLADIDAVQIPERRGRVRVLSDRLIAMVHRAGAEVHVWTVNDVSHMKALTERGVDGIVTDRVDAAVKAFFGTA